MVVGKPKRPVPERVRRAFVEDINRYRFPDDSPVPVAEAIFGWRRDRSRLYEGCRFCQAGILQAGAGRIGEVVETLVSATEKGGYDKPPDLFVTADIPRSRLVKKVVERLRPKKISLRVQP
jgi:hypothetical protein